MKKILFIVILLLTVFYGNIMAQYNNHYIFAGNKAVYCELLKLTYENNLKLSKVQYADIETLQSNKKWKKVKSISPVKSFKEFVSNYKTLSSGFPIFTVRNENKLHKIWNRYAKLIQNDSTTLQLLYFSLPYKIALGLTTMIPVKQTGTYTYRIILYDANKNILATGKKETVHLPAHTDLSSLSYLKKAVIMHGLKLYWKIDKNKYAGSYFVLYIQKQSKKDFVKSDISRFINVRKEGKLVEFSDTLIHDAPYAKYFVESYDAYLNKGFTSDTVLISNSNRQDFPMPENFTVSVDKHTGIVHLKWDLTNRKIVRTVDVYRGIYFNKPFVRIASVQSAVTGFEDKNVKAGVRYYYYLQSSGYLNEKSRPTIKIYGYSESDEKPLKPAFVFGNSVKNGVLLQWEHGNDFIKGYFVYRSNGSSDSLIKISPLIPNNHTSITYIDTAKWLSPKWFYAYAVKSVSQNNVLSNFSDTVKIRSPVKTTAPKPYGLEAIQKQDKVWIGWQNMLAHYNTILGYKLKRIDKVTGDTVVLNALIPATTNYYIDTTAQYGMSYYYDLSSKDVFGNESDVAEVFYRPAISLPPAPLGLTCTKTSDSLTIAWNPVYAKRIIGYRVYKYKRGGKPELVGISNIQTTSLTTALPPKGLWFYYVVSYDSNNSSLPGNEVFVKKK